MRVDEESGSSEAGRPEGGVGSGVTFTRLLLLGSGLLVALAMYFLATTCWEGRWYAGCRTSRLGSALGTVFVAQVFGSIGFVRLRRASRRGRSSTPGQGAMSGPPPMRHFRFWLMIVVALVLVGAGVASFVWGTSEAAIFACWLSSDCGVAQVIVGVSFIVLGEVFGVVGFFVARRAFRRRPWRRNTPPEPST
ncbi:hypothetical protein BMS3Bbin02_01058 [bacterium BMS3Bbin02]|nr:hypothetical protein BMS3Bbin02_01058 [bacterium BMS3Bbin02]